MNLNQTHDKKMQEIIEKLKNVSYRKRGGASADSDLPSLSALQLRQKLLDAKAADPSSEELINAILQFHDKQLKDLNSHFALTDVLTESALTKAEELEQQIAINNADQFPLYGFVLSIKDSINIKGTISSCGLLAGLKVYERETPFIGYLEKNGAVIMSKANVPQLLFAMESWNNVFGNVSNPWKTDRSAGGSSGGDAALIALGHVNGGFGSDIAGSLRIPALFCGICAMNMSFRRIDRSVHAIMLEQHEDFAKFPEGQFNINGTVGPLARNVDDLARLTEVMINYYKVNPRLPPVPWRTDLPPVRRVGVVTEWDNIFELTETNRRAMAMAIDALKKQGIEVVEIDMRAYNKQLVQTICSLFYKNHFLNSLMNGGVELGEPLLPVYSTMKQVFGLPRLAIKFLRLVLKDPKKKIFIEAFYQSTRFNNAHFMAVLEAYKTDFVNDLKQKGVELFLCPGMMPAIIKGTSNKCNLWAMYMFVWTALKFASGALSVTRVLENEQTYNSQYNHEFEQSIRTNMENSAGLPVGIQVVSYYWQEEQILKVMKIIEEGVSFK